MIEFDKKILQQLHLPQPDSHKGQNGKLLLIGGSQLFHAASLWALTIASKVVDMVFYASVPDNNKIVQQAKQEFRNGIVISRNDVEDYAKEADCILIGPGMVRSQYQVSNIKYKIDSLYELNNIEDEGMQTRALTYYMLHKYPHKKFVLDAGAIQMMDAAWLKDVSGNVIVTPHAKEFETLFNRESSPEHAVLMSKEYNCVVLLKGKEDIVCSPSVSVRISGGNAGMTKGGTGDVLAGLVASLACTNDMLISAVSGSYFNKIAGERLADEVGIFFNSSDLANEIPRVMGKELRKISEQ